MAYGTIKVDQVTFTNGGVDQTITVSGIVESISGNITATGTIQADTIIGTTTVSGATVTGVVGQFTTATITSGVFASGTAATPSVSVGTTSNGIYSPGVNQLAISTNGTGRLFVDASGNINIDSGGVYYDAVNNRLAVGTTTPQAPLSVSNGGANGIEIYSDYAGIGQSGIVSYNRSTSQRTDLYISTDETIFLTSGSERARIDSSGRLLIGTSSAVADASTVSRSLQILGNNASTAGQFIARFDNGVNAPSLILGKSRGATVGSFTVVNSGDQIGRLVFDATDGTKFVNAALIAAEVDGTPGTNDMPGRLVFSTTADGASSPVERMRINNAGNVGIGTTSPGYLLDCQKTGSQLIRSQTNDTGSGASTGGFLGEYLGGGGGTNTQISIAAGNNYGFLSTLTNSPLFIGTNSTEKLRIDTSGRVLIGTGSNSGGALLQVNDNRIRIASAKTPASASDTGTTGEVCWDANYVYVCTATNTWKRSALSTW